MSTLNRSGKARNKRTRIDKPALNLMSLEVPFSYKTRRTNESGHAAMRYSRRELYQYMIPCVVNRNLRCRDNGKHLKSHGPMLRIADRANEIYPVNEPSSRCIKYMLHTKHLVRIYRLSLII